MVQYCIYKTGVNPGFSNIVLNNIKNNIDAFDYIENDKYTYYLYHAKDDIIYVLWHKKNTEKTCCGVYILEDFF